MKAGDLLGRRGGKIPCVTVLFGNEPWFMDQVVARYRREFLGEEGEGFLSAQMPRGPGDKEGLTVGAAVDEARTVPMFGGRKLVALRGGSIEDSEVVVVAALAKSSPDFCRFVLMLPKLGKAASKRLSGAGAVLAESKRLFDTPYDAGRPEWDTALNKWVTGRARERGLTLSLMNAHALTSIVGNELGALESALEKLAVGAVGRRDIREEDIHALVGGSRGYGAFAFGDAIYRRDTAEAYRVVRNSFVEGMEDQRGRISRDAGYVAGRMLWSAQFRLGFVVKGRRALDEGRTREEAVSVVGGNPMMAKRTVDLAGRFALEELLGHIVLLADAEAELRTATPPEVVIEALIPRLTGAADG